MLNDNRQLRILLVEDDEDDFILTRELLSRIDTWKSLLEWVPNYNAGLDAIEKYCHDVYLLDYRLGDRNGLDLLRHAISKGCKAPIILLTGQGDYKVDLEAMEAGAADYLIKGQITSHLLERSIRYSLQQKKAEEELRESQNQLRRLSAQLLSVQENERKRIAGELHDSVGQCLSAVKFSVESAIHQISRGNPLPGALNAVIPLVQRAMEEVRRIMTDLRPSILDDLGIIVTIGWFCREFKKVYESIQVDLDLAVEEDDVPDALKIVVFRIIQESFHNAAKHSNAERIRVALTKDGSTLKLSITDNGRGFDVGRALTRQVSGRGFGLTSMRERTELAGGRFAITSERGKGTAIGACWPLAGT